MTTQAVLPAFSLRDPDAGDVAFPSGRPAVICFVKEDCPTCNDAIPLVDALYRSAGGRIDVLVPGQTAEGNAVLRQRHGLEVPLLDDSSLKVSFD